MQSPFLLESSQLHLLSEVDDIFQNLIGDNQDQQYHQNLEDIIDDFMHKMEEDDDGDQDQDQDDLQLLPSFRRIAPSLNLSTFDSQLKLNQVDHNEEEGKQNSDSESESPQIKEFYEYFHLNTQDEIQEANNEAGEIEYLEVRYKNDVYKIPVFQPKNFDEHQTIEDKLIFENTDLILSQQMGDFQKFLTTLQFKPDNTVLNYLRMMLSVQRASLLRVYAQLNKMSDLILYQSKRNPSNYYSRALKEFNLHFKSFKESADSVIDSNYKKITIYRRYFDAVKPAYFKTQQDDKIDPKDILLENRILEIQQLPYDRKISIKSTCSSLLQFKARLLFDSFKHFQHHHIQQRCYNTLIDKIKKLRDILKIYLMFKGKVKFDRKAHSKYNIELSYQEALVSFYNGFKTMKVQGIPGALCDGHLPRRARKSFGKYLSQPYQRFNQYFY